MITQTVWAVDSAPRIKRVCLNVADSVASVYWEEVNDACASFTDYSIYGREDKFSLFQLLKKENNINTNSTQIKLPNRKRWEFFIVVNKGCNGIDSFSSDTIFLDNEEPTRWQLDSVSVDQNTQKVIAGWSTHDTTDVEGYFIYNVEGGSNSLIGNENDLYFEGVTEDPSQKAITHLISAYDSCGNTSPLSLPSTTIFLTQSIDTCANQMTYTWTPYVGWNSIQEYILYVSTNGNPYQNMGKTNSNTQTITYLYTPGDNYCAYVRAINGENNSISSSSNRVCQSTNALIKPNTLYIRKVTVENHDSLKIYSIQEPSIDSMVLQRQTAGEGWVEINNIKPVPNNYSYTDINAMFNTSVYEYRLISFNSCGQKTDTSNVSKNVLLTLENDDTELQWTPYSTFLNGTNEYSVVKSTNSSTWNNEARVIENGQTNYTHTPNSTTDQDGNAFCYCVMAIEGGTNTMGYQDTCLSNLVCTKGEFVHYIPNAFKPTGVNTTFLPYFQNIEETSYSLRIANRWGEIVFESSDPEIGWDGNYNGTTCPMGVYVYVIQALGKDGNIINKSGSLTLIR